MTEKTFWQRLKKIGWLDYLPEDSHEEVRGQLKKNLQKPNSKWAFLALAQGGFDVEINSYKDVLEGLAQASRGIFHPTQIKELWLKKEDADKISFQHNSQDFSCTVPHAGWFDLKVLELVNQALEISGTTQRFIPLPAADQFLTLVFVPPSVYEAAVKEKLIPNQEDTFESEDAFIFNDLALFFSSCDEERERDGKRALEYAKNALKIEPLNPFYMETLAAAFAENGDFEQAMSWQKRAMKNREIRDDPGSHARLELYRNKQPYRVK